MKIPSMCNIKKGAKNMILNGTRLRVTSHLYKNMSSLTLRVKLLSENATVPARGSAMAAGYDLSSAVSTVVPAGGKALVPTDVAVALPEGVYGRVAPRSGLAWKKHIDVGAGVIDRDYRGNVGVVLFNHSKDDLQVNVGDRIAQLILERYETAEVLQVEDLDDTERGEGGFGSTGVKRQKIDK
jgi:dUTP pyrophosphatase